VRDGLGRKELMSGACKDLPGMRSRSRRRGGLFLLLALYLPVLCSSAPVLSQDSEPARPAHPAPRRDRKVNFDDQLKNLAKNLNLDQEQQAAIKRILERRQQEILRIMHNSLGPDGIGRLQALQIATAEQIRSVLNDEQKKKYNALAPHPPQTSPQPDLEDWMKATKPH
jgi:hypothetical protein